MEDRGGTPHYRVAILGAGFSGLGMGINLKRSGESDFIVFDKEAGVGGTWWVNDYPGCACDVESHLYSFSFELNPEWSRLYARQQEIQRYLEACVEKYGLAPHLRLETEITSMAWEEAERRWRLTDAHGNQTTADVVVSGIGGLSAPYYPDIPGLASFQGRRFHSQQWDHDYPLEGKRVAVIGTGASAIQFVPQIQRKVERLDLYQRTPPWIVPKPDRRISEREQERFRRYPLVQKALRAGIYCMLEGRVFGFALHPKLMEYPKRVALRHLERQVPDPEMRRKLTPDYSFGCKRVLISNDFYPALSKPNVHLLTDGIREIRPHGVVDGNGVEREVDAIILGTGFRAADPIPAGMVKGRGGEDLAERWRDGPEAYKGTTVAGFPNLFLLMGPNTGLGHSSVVYMIESQIRYVMDALNKMRRHGLRTVEVRPKAQQAFNARVQGRLGGTVWNAGGCRSWYLHPVSGRNVTLWPGFTWQFRRRTRRFDLRAYDTERLSDPVREEGADGASTNTVS